jgi:hypothetical protein
VIWIGSWDSAASSRSLKNLDLASVALMVVIEITSPYNVHENVRSVKRFITRPLSPRFLIPLSTVCQSPYHPISRSPHLSFLWMTPKLPLTLIFFEFPHKLKPCLGPTPPVCYLIIASYSGILIPRFSILLITLYSLLIPLSPHLRFSPLFILIVRPHQQFYDKKIDPQPFFYLSSSFLCFFRAFSLRRY